VLQPTFVVGDRRHSHLDGLPSATGPVQHSRWLWNMQGRANYQNVENPNNTLNPTESRGPDCCRRSCPSSRRRLGWSAMGRIEGPDHCHAPVETGQTLAHVFFEWTTHGTANPPRGSG